MKSTVFFRSVKAPNEKRIKSGFANNCAIALTSSSRKERRIRRAVFNSISPADSFKGGSLLRRRCQSPQAQMTCDARMIFDSLVKKMQKDEEGYPRPAQPPDTSSLNTVRE